MPRARTGTISVEWHGDHWDFRFTLPDGNRSRRECQPNPTREAGESDEQARARAKDEAKREARELMRLAWSLGATRKPEEPAEEPGEPMSEWIGRWLDERRERGLRSVDDDDGRWRKWIAPHLAKRPIVAVQKIDLERIVERLDEQVRAGELSWKTARHVWGLLTKMFSDACRSKRLSLRVRDDNGSTLRRFAGPTSAYPTKAKSYARLPAGRADGRPRPCETVPLHAGAVSSPSWSTRTCDRASSRRSNGETSTSTAERSTCTAPSTRTAKPRPPRRRSRGAFRSSRRFVPCSM